MQTLLPTTADESYLQPYLRAASQHGAGFPSLLWSSEKSQRARFDAICRIHELNEKSVLDAGCGRADLMGYLIDKDIRPADYVGLEAVDALADEAEARRYPSARIVHGDFVQDPLKLFVGADVIVFSGSLNTLEPDVMYGTLAHAFEAASEAVVFNFLSSAALAGQDYLVWHRTEQVLAFVRRSACEVRVLSDYLQGDCTIAMVKHSSEE